MKTILAFAVLSTLAAGTIALAQTQHDGHHAAPASVQAPHVKPFQESDAAMMKNMDLPFTDSADVDFVHRMIPHHQGAIQMAKVVQQYGKDPEVQKWAKEIIAAQEKEIAEMQAWLKKNAK